MAGRRRTKEQEIEAIIRAYREKIGQPDIDMDSLADDLERQGYSMPKPVTPHAALVKQLTRAARAATRTDEITGNRYRAYHCVEERLGQLAFSLWRDIDEAPREFMQRSLKAREDQVIDQQVQMTFDTEYWNRINPNEEPLVVNTDSTLAVEIRKNAPKMIDDGD